MPDGLQGKVGWAAMVCAAGLVMPAMLQAADDAHSADWDQLEPICASCHNSTDWAGGVAFDVMSMDDFAADAEVWEEAVRKLRGRLMPPPGEKQPPQQTIDGVVKWLETRLDANAAAHPDPGYVGLHRLNRDEYAREIERILGLSVEVETLLPKDVASEGFVNQAATLRFSPSFLSQYIVAARTVARQAIGRIDGKPSSREYRPDTSLDQSKHVDGLPLGTRGGFWVDHEFPADGEYVFSIREFFFMGAGYVTKVDAPHTVILTIDGKRVFQATAGGPEDLKAVDQRQAIAADEIQQRFDHITVPVKAGRRRIGVTFVARSMVESDSPLQPIAQLPEMERVPNIPGFTVSGPFHVTGLGDTPSRRRILVCRPNSAAEELPCARRILVALAGAAYRRPVTEEDLAAPMAFYTEARQAQDFEAGIEGGLTAILSSTKFLLREVPVVARPGEAEPLGDLELASRLAFFLWGEGPDQRLIDLATAGHLHDAKMLQAEVRRMLVDARAASLVNDFAFQWLAVARADNILPDPIIFPDFDRNLRDGLTGELRRFLASVLVPDRSLLDLLRSDTTFINERLARHYGVPNVQGAQFREVKLTDPNRFGLLGKGALMLATSYGNRTSPVLRGSWVLETLYGTPPASPPPGVEQFKENEPGKNHGTVRERLEQHRQQKSCNACHGVIDPLGFALENYDITGAWRDRDLDANQDIDARGRLAGGQTVGSPAELSRAILARPDQFVQAFTEKLMTYALGRQLGYRDMPVVRAIVRAAAARDYDFGAIVEGIVGSDAFRMRRLPEEEPAVEPRRTAQASTGR